MNQILPGFSEGFSLALRLWLFFLISLVLLRYPVVFSIIIGAIGGFSGGWIFAWWKSKEGPIASKEEEEEEEEEEEKPEENSVKLSGLKLAKQRNDARKQKRNQKRTIGLTRLWKK